MIEPPLLNPTVSELTDRVVSLSMAGRRPESLGMSPETWARLCNEAWPGRPLDQIDHTFMNLPVTLIEGAKGVAITFRVER